MLILSIESSCDETAVSIIEDGRKIISNEVLSQIEIHKKYGGVVPEIASRLHIEGITHILDKALEKGNVTLQNIDAIAVTYGPGLIGALLVGVNFAKSLAYALNKPLIPVHHLRGHIAANYLAYENLKPPFLSLVVSGGHTHLIDVKDYTKMSVIGATRDDAAGEAFDKVARILDLPYPGGVKIDELSKKGDCNAISFPKVNFKDAPLDFSFSGVKTNVMNYVNNSKQKNIEINKEDIAASFSKAVCDTLREKCEKALQITGYKDLVIAGGVSANSMLRDTLTKMAKKNKISLYIPPIYLCTDNAAMIGAQGYYEYKAGNISDINLNAIATKDIQIG